MATSKADESRCKRITVLINPASGHGKAAKLVGVVGRRLSGRLPADTEIDVRVTNSFEHAAALAIEAAQLKSEALVVVGGDGMSNIGFNICARTGMKLGIIPGGTGNDFLRGVGVKPRVVGALKSIIAGQTRDIDLLEVTGPNLEYSFDKSLMIGSVLSTGFDSKVNLRANRARIRFGAPTYAWAILAESRQFKPLDYRIEVDGRVIECPAMLCAVGNAGVIGGGVKMCPDADPTDGLLDVTLVDPVPWRVLLRNFGSIYTGKFTSLPFIHQYQGRHVKISGEDLYGMADGEEIGRPPFELRIRPRALKLFNRVH